MIGWETEMQKFCGQHNQLLIVDCISYTEGHTDNRMVIRQWHWRAVGQIG